ncbi:MAG: hypothetical protein Q4G50_12715 [Corynebacterium sp.]|uniref:hypothetical protein n=1 Tax=Corynebacterium sp. TaxID=1720 RepID=UPI0026DF069A|nr:hypothetical protein [Corynebacterium sp.]MDO5670847.1 hypothetical protein [Corynebacterium sp.]
MKKNRPWLRFIEGPNAGAGSAPSTDDAAQSTEGVENTTGAQDTNQPPSDDSQSDDEEGENPDARGSKKSVLADLAKERDKRQSVEAQRDKLAAKVAAFERAQMTDAEKSAADRKELETKYSDAMAKIAAYERKNALAEISAEFKIPAAMADRIQGETPEQMRADAQALAKSLGPYTGPSDPSAGQGGGKPAPAASLDAALAAHFTHR